MGKEWMSDLSEQEKEELLSLLADDQAPGEAPPPAAKAGLNRKPSIDAGQQDLKLISRQAIKALQSSNEINKKIYQHGGLVRLEISEQGHRTLKELTPDRMRHELAGSATWYKLDRNGTARSAKPPIDVVRDVLATPELPFPGLTAITQAPAFAPDGTLVSAPGYHSASKTYYDPSNGLSIPDVAENPSLEDRVRAKELILNELLADFPFADNSDRSHAFALLLNPFVRGMVIGPTPLHLIEASTQGSGKGLLAEVLLYPALGKAIGVIPPPRDDEELRKAITARLREGRSAILFDNVYKLSSAVMAAALTADSWDDRILGKNETVSLPIRWAWISTANNASVSTDIARRSLRIRLTPEQDRPWLRTGFRHPDIRGWVAENRGELIWAALTLAQAWLAAGKPRAKITPLGSYEAWSLVIGGILEYASIPGFLDNIIEFYEVADTEGAAWRELISAWWEKFGDQTVKTNDLFPLAVDIISFDLGRGGTDRAQRTAFGMRLARQKDRIFGSYRVEAGGIEHRAKMWKLKQIKNM